MGASKVVLSLLVSVLLLHVAVTLDISAFNIKCFGEAKMNKTDIADIIVDIIKKFDITLVQEVRDKNLNAVTKLEGMLNSNTPGLYKLNYSEPLGQSNYAERYLFIWRSDKVSILVTEQINATGDFSRPPYVVKIQSNTTQVKQFVMVPLHSKPDNAVKEIDKLYDVYNNVRTNWKIDDIILLGDFNAGCSYVKDSDWPRIRLRTQTSCDWLIKDNDDTTVTQTTHCPYDRIVVCGNNLKKAVKPHPDRIFNFQNKYKLSYKKALNVSDHFPVAMILT